MLQRKEIIEILRQAAAVDSRCEMFGAETHRYKLNPPVKKAFVRDVEERYGFLLPEEYVHFITEVGDGGAGPDYGIYPFGDFLRKVEGPGRKNFEEAYRQSLSAPFAPRPMRAAEVEAYAIATKEAYERNPGRYFIQEKLDEDASCMTDGFFVLGTHGCQWDFGLIITGEMRGQVFDTDNEGAYGFVAGSFYEFYRGWLDQISHSEWFERELEKRRRLFAPARVKET